MHFFAEPSCNKQKKRFEKGAEYCSVRNLEWEKLSGKITIEEENKTRVETYYLFSNCFDLASLNCTI